MSTRIVIGVRFRNSAKVYYFSPGDVPDIQKGEYVIVETTRGQEAGLVVMSPRPISEQDIPGQLKAILRRANPPDLTLMEKYHQQESEAMRLCQEKVSEYHLPMKLIRAEYNFDGTHLTFYFTSEKRVDFRELVKDLAHIFRTRIELRQIGVRDDVKLLGGYGRCGRPHCCATWLSEFCPISIRMAKLQDLPLSPMEISGACGRLLCCLDYEFDFYNEMKEQMPPVGQTIETPRGPGKVVVQNILQENLVVEYPDETTATWRLDELQSETVVSSAGPSRWRSRQRRKRSQKKKE